MKSLILPLIINFLMVAFSFLSHFDYTEDYQKKFIYLFRIGSSVYFLSVLCLEIMSVNSYHFFENFVFIPVFFLVLSFLVLFMVSFYLVISYRNSFKNKNFIFTFLILCVCIFYIIYLVIGFVQAWNMY